MIDWTEKYRPKNLKDVLGNHKAVETLRSWAEDWERGVPKKRVVLLAGKPGVGKTSSALALANEFGWGAIELNASDQRNYAIVKRIAGLGASYETFTDSGEFITTRSGGRKLIILDEVDHVFGREDRGGIRAIADIIRFGKQPVVLIVNDYYALTKRSSVIRTSAQKINFGTIRQSTIKATLRRISELEHIEVANDVLELIAAHSEGDLRSAINDLQAVCEQKTRVNINDVQSLGHRDIKITMFKALGKIFKSMNATDARRVLDKLDESPETLILWLDENLPLEYTVPEDLARGYDMLSKADIYLGRVRRRQAYSLWAYAVDMMSAGIALAKTEPSHRFIRYQFPGWLLKMSRSKASRDTLSSLLAKLGRHCHTSKNAANELLPTFKLLFHDRAFALNMVKRLGLDASELSYLTDKDADSTEVKRLLEDAGKPAKPVTKEMF